MLIRSIWLFRKWYCKTACYGCIQTRSKYGNFVRFLTLFHYIKFLTVYAMSVNDVIVINNILVKKRTSFPILTQSECSLKCLTCFFHNFRAYKRDDRCLFLYYENSDDFQMFFGNSSWKQKFMDLVKTMTEGMNKFIPDLEAENMDPMIVSQYSTNSERFVFWFFFLKILI